MNRILQRGIPYFIGLILVLLAVNIWFGYENIHRMRQGSLAVSHTRDVLFALERVLSQMKDAETGQRGFIITGETRYLEPYNTAVAHIDEQLALLENLVKAEPVQRARVPELKKVIALRMKTLNEGIVARNTTGFETARDLIASNRGKAEMDEVRRQVGEMIKNESASRDARLQQSAQQYRIAFSSSLISDSIALLMIGAFGYLLYRYLRSRERTEANIFEQRELFRTTIASIGDGVVTTDTQGRVTSLNGVAQSLTGWNEAAALGQPLNIVFKIVHEQTGAPAVNPVQRVLSEGVIVGLTGHTVLIAKDGSARPIDDSAAPIKNLAGSIVGVVMVFHDVTERRKTEHALLQANEKLEERVRERTAELSQTNARFQAMYDQGIFAGVMTLDGTVTDVNRSALDRCGFARDDVIGKLFWETGWWNRSAEIQAWLKDGFALALQGKLFRGESDYFVADGSRRIVDFAFMPIKDEFGKVLYVMPTGLDITERRRAEADHRAAEGLRAEMRALETLNRVGKAVAAELDLERVVQIVTDTATELTGAAFGAFFYNVINESGDAYTLYTISGVPREAFASFPMPRSTAVFAPTFSGKGVVRSNDITKDVRYGQSAPHHGMPKGHLPVRSYLAAPVVSRSGEVIGGLFFGHPEVGVFDERAERVVVGIASQAAIAIDNARLYQAAQKEIAERTRAEAALQQSEIKLRRQADELENQLIASGRLVSLGEITASMAHEFNNPLGIVLGFSQDLMSEFDSASSQYQALKIINDETKRCQKIIQELLQYSRPKSAEAEPIDVKHTIEKTLNLVANHLYKQKIAALAEIPGDLPPVHADAQQIEQVCLNLFLNAIDAMPEGGKLTVTVEEEHESTNAPTVVIRITDTGFGIEQNDLPKIFLPFFSAKKGKGLGLGLPICERIIKNHGGRIEVESEPGSGTIFSVYLPRDYRPKTTAQAEIADG